MQVYTELWGIGKCTCTLVDSPRGERQMYAYTCTHGGNRQVYTDICLFPPTLCTLACLLVFLHAIELLEALSKTLAKPINFSSLGVVLPVLCSGVLLMAHPRHPRGIDKCTRTFAYSPQLRVHLGNRRVYVSPISSIKMREIEVPADLHRFPPSVLGLCFPSVLLWKLD